MANGQQIFEARMSDDRGTNPGGVYPAGSAQPAAGSGLTQDPDAAPGGVAQGGAPLAARGSMPQASAPGFGMRAATGVGPQQLAPPGMMVNPDFLKWRQMAAQWHAEKSRRQMQFLSACNVIRRDAATGYAIDIEADSTIAADEQAEKQARTEFLTAIMPLLQVIVPQIQQNPAIAPLAKALVMFGMRAFPAARSLEEMFEQAFATLAQAPPPPPQQKGNVKSPAELAQEAQIAKGEQQVDMAKVQSEQQQGAVQLQIQQQKNAADMWKTFAQLQQDQQKQQAENMFRSAELSQQSEVQQARSQLATARIASMLSRQTAGLV
jgi:hypothetical protein